MNNTRNLASIVKGNGHPIVFLHGIPGSSKIWNPVVSRLRDRFQCHQIDLLGFGQSSKPTNIEGLWVDAQAAAIEHYLDRENITRAIFVAHDFGGPVALRCYDRMANRFDGLVAASFNAFPDTPIPLPLSSIFWPFVGAFMEKLIFSRASLAMMLKQGIGDQKVQLDPDIYLGDLPQTRSIAKIFNYALRNLNDAYRPVEASLSSIKVPTAVLWGTRDPFFALAHGKRTAEAIPGACFIELAGAGHFTPEESPDTFIVQIEALYDRLTGKTGPP